MNWYIFALLIFAAAWFYFGEGRYAKYLENFPPMELSIGVALELIGVAFFYTGPFGAALTSLLLLIVIADPFF